MLCQYERTVFKADSGYCIVAYKTKDAEIPAEAESKWNYGDGYHHITAIGYHLPTTAQADVELTGNWTSSKYGLQLTVEHFREIVPQDIDGLTAYLGSGLIKGVGPGIAKTIVSTFGPDTIEVLNKDPEQLLKVKGISEKKLKKIIRSYSETVRMSGLVGYLAPYGVSIKAAAKIMEEFGDASLQIVKSDPFQLTKVRGFGFLTVDHIARSTNVSLKHPLRYAGAIHYILDEADKQGHLFLPGPEVIARCHELLNRDLEHEIVTESDIRAAISREWDEGKIYVEHTRVYQCYIRKCEVNVAKRVVKMLLGPEPYCPRDLNIRIDRAERSLGCTLSPSQRTAVGICLSNRCSIMTGGPGTGKSATRFCVK